MTGGQNLEFYCAHPCLHCQLHTAPNLTLSHPELFTCCINIQFCINDYYPANTKHFHDVVAMFWRCYRYDRTFQQHYENTFLFAWVGCVFTKIMWLSAECPNLYCLNVKSWISTIFVVLFQWKSLLKTLLEWLERDLLILKYCENNKKSGQKIAI